MKRDMVTVNNVMLSEFLKNNEMVEEDLKRNKEFKDDSYVSGVKQQHIKPKYKEHQESNGKVKILNQEQINAEEYEKKMTESIKAGDFDAAMVISFLYLSQNRKPFFLSEVADEIEKFSEMNNIAFNSKDRYRLRFKWGKIRKSQLCELITTIKRNSFNNPTSTNKYIATDAAIRMSYTEAIKLAKEQKYETVSGKPRKRWGQKSKQKQIEKDVQTEVKEQEQIEKDVQTETIDKIKSHIYKLASDGGGITFTGDIHIHINIKNV